jgi:glucosamine-6-phosphate deaminase
MSRGIINDFKTPLTGSCPKISHLSEMQDPLISQPPTHRDRIIRTGLEHGKPLASLEEFDERDRQWVEADLREKSNDEALLPRHKNIVCLSPHPDDDVICCGATLLKLAARGNRITVIYGVSGANAVRDKDVLGHLLARQPRLLSHVEANLAAGQSLDESLIRVRAEVVKKDQNASSAALMHQLKGLVREVEASEGCRKMGAKPVFLNLPFYGDGSNRTPISDADVQLMRDALEVANPDLVFMTGELADPHGTHEVCERIFDLAVSQLFEGPPPFERWEYRGSYQEWRVEEACFFSVFDQSMMQRKLDLILDHVSQLEPLFPGNDTREFWERVWERNRQNARELQTLGALPASPEPYFAEVFHRHSDS